MRVPDVSGVSVAGRGLLQPGRQRPPDEVRDGAPGGLRGVSQPFREHSRLRPVLLVAFDTGMRQREVLDLRWEQVDLRSGTIDLAPQDTKSEAPRRVVLTARVVEALRALPRGIGAAFVFANPKTGKAWQDLRECEHGQAAGILRRVE